MTSLRGGRRLPGQTTICPIAQSEAGHLEDATTGLEEQPQRHHPPRLTAENGQHGRTVDALEDQSGPVLQLHPTEMARCSYRQRSERLGDHPLALDRLRRKVGVVQLE